MNYEYRKTKSWIYIRHKKIIFVVFFKDYVLFRSMR